MASLKGNALIGQSGGPTAVINQSLVGIVEECLAAPGVGQVYGALQGIRGVLDEEFVDLGRESREELERVALTPCAALRSVRAKPDRDDCHRALEVFRAHDIRYFFYIGGNDSAETAHLLNEVAVDEDYEVRLFHVPKTIDNDLRETDHCPGYGSAAKFVIQALQGDNEDNRSLGGVKIDVIMGRNAGWLTAASALARRGEGEGPHLIYLPETDFSLESFVGDVDAMLAEHGRCLITVSEGIHDAAGNLIAQPKEKDTFGNVQLSGTGFLGDHLAGAVRNGLGSALRVRADTFGYLQRSFFGVVSEQDSDEAREVGRTAARLATSGAVPHGSVVILREEEEDGAYRPRYDCCPLEKVARLTKEMPAGFRAGDHDVSPAFLDYLRPLVGELTRTGRLVGHPVPKRL
ncbi:MAG: 6-phosphofructokinase [Planctomycetota bacterium]